MQISRRNMLGTSLAGAFAVGAGGFAASARAGEIEPEEKHDEFDVVVVGAG